MSQNDMSEKTLLDTDTGSNGQAEEAGGTEPMNDQDVSQGLNPEDLEDLQQPDADGVLEDSGAPPGLDLSALQIGSTTLSRLPESKRPDPSTVCETCPAALWYSRGVKVLCYCRIMHLVSWETGEKDPIKVCDGPAIAASQQ